MMKIFGHPWIESPPFYTVDSSTEIKMTPTNSMVRLSALPSSLHLAQYCQQHRVAYAIEVENIKDAIFANLLGANYLITSKALATELMPIAQNYLFDTQILAIIEHEKEIEEMAKVNVDGVLF
jgi:galactitol-specific phosphotransferase system IIB component